MSLEDILSTFLERGGKGHLLALSGHIFLIFFVSVFIQVTILLKVLFLEYGTLNRSYYYCYAMLISSVL